MTKFEELIQDAPKFFSMERGALVIFAYVMYAAGIKVNTENANLRKLVRGLHMAYIETLNECESLNEELIWECSGSIDDDIAKSKAKFEVNRHLFDAALCELGVKE